MSRSSCALAVCTLLAASTAALAQPPKFSRLKTEDLKAATAPDLKGGIAFSVGAFDLSDKPDAMVLIDLKFPNGTKFVHQKLAYFGEYTDPGTGIAGYLYHLKSANYERYFLVAKEGVQGSGDSQRYIVDYYRDGTVKSYFLGTFMPRP